MKYIAFLRGINVSGNKKVPMADLKTCFEEAGFTSVKTLLNTGNVIFESNSKDLTKLENDIEKILEEKFGFHIDTIVKNRKEIEEIINLDPFKNISVTKETRLYLTFVKGTITSSLKIPYISPNKNFKIISIFNNTILSLLTVNEKNGTTDGMEILEKEFGKQITTRNWNTVCRLFSQL